MDLIRNRRTGGMASGAAVMILLLLTFNYLVPNYVQYQVSPLGPVIMERFGLSTSQFSALFTASMIPAIFLSIPGGVLMDRIGPKKVIGCGLVVASAGCLFRIGAQTYPALLAATVLTGFAATFINAGAGKILIGYYPAEQINAKMGIVVAGANIGMTAAMFTSARFPGIREAFIAGAILELIATIVWFLFMKDPGREATEAEKQRYRAAEKNSSASEYMRDSLHVALHSRNVWFTGLTMFFLMGMNVLFNSFAPTALAAKGVDAVAAGNISAFITIGNLAGCFIIPPVIARTGRQKTALAAVAVLGCIGIIFSWYITSMALLTTVFFLTGVCLGGMIPPIMMMPVTFPEIGQRYAGTAGGIVGTMQLAGAVILPTWVIAPAAGDRFTMLYILGGIGMLLSALMLTQIRTE